MFISLDLCSDFMSGLLCISGWLCSGDRIMCWFVDKIIYWINVWLRRTIRPDPAILMHRASKTRCILVSYVLYAYWCEKKIHALMFKVLKSIHTSELIYLWTRSHWSLILNNYSLVCTHIILHNFFFFSCRSN